MPREGLRPDFDAREWNPYFLAYCRAHGMEPEAMLAHDRGRWLGGTMAGFVVWIRQQWRAWDATQDHPRGWSRYDARSEDERARFGAWLDGMSHDSHDTPASVSQLTLFEAAA